MTVLNRNGEAMEHGDEGGLRHLTKNLRVMAAKSFHELFRIIRIAQLKLLFQRESPINLFRERDKSLERSFADVRQQRC